MNKPSFCGSYLEKMRSNGPSAPKLLSNFQTLLAILMGLSFDPRLESCNQVVNEVLKEYRRTT